YKHEIASFFALDAAATQATDLPPGASAPIHYLRTANPLNPENLAAYPHRISTNRSNPYVYPLGYKNFPLHVFGTYLCTANPVPTLAPKASIPPAILASYGGWCLWELVLQRRAKAPERTDRSRWWLFVTTTLGASLIFPASGVGLRLPGPRWAPVAVGLGLIIAGWALRRWSVRTLGRWFTVTVTVEPDQRVVDTGPYRLLRHPSYTGMLVSLLGMGVGLD